MQLPSQPLLSHASERVARRREMIREIGAALEQAGFRTLDQQANVLGLPRSTTWTIRTAIHKNSGLSPETLLRMLKSERLPATVRIRISEYIAERATGAYGENPERQRRFKKRLTATIAGLRTKPAPASKPAQSEAATDQFDRCHISR